NIAQWDGAVWMPLGSGLGGSNVAVNAVAAFNGSLVVGGSWTTAGGQSAPCLARWDGAAWFPIPGTPCSISSLMADGPNLLVGGFTTVSIGGGGRGQLSYLKQWDGATWATLAEGWFDAQHYFGWGAGTISS